MALSFSTFSNTGTAGSYRYQTFQLLGTPVTGQVVTWGSYGVSISYTVTNVDTLDTVGYAIANLTNGKSITFWQTSYGSYTAGNPVGFPPTAIFNPGDDRVYFTLNYQNQFSFYISPVAATAVPATPTPLPNATSTPTVSPATVTPLPVITCTNQFVSASIIGTSYYYTFYQNNCSSSANIILSSSGDSQVLGTDFLNGVELCIPNTAASIWVMGSLADCPECIGPVLTTNTPPTATPTPSATPSPTPTVTPLGATLVPTFQPTEVPCVDHDYGFAIGGGTSTIDALCNQLWSITDGVISTQPYTNVLGASICNNQSSALFSPYNGGNRWFIMMESATYNVDPQTDYCRYIQIDPYGVVLSNGVLNCNSSGGGAQNEF